MGDDLLTFGVEGLQELDHALKRLPEQLQQKVLQKAALAGAGVIRDEARRLCPKGTGGLANSIVARKVKTNPGEAKYYVGPSRSTKKTKSGGKWGYEVDGFYAHLVEFGTAPHVIKADKKKVLAIRANKRASKGAAKRWINTFPAVQVAHPGSAAHPFMRPAFDNKHDEALEKFKQSLARAIERGEVIQWKTIKGW